MASRGTRDNDRLLARCPLLRAIRLFALLGLVSTHINGELLTYWPEVCLVPLVMLFAIDRLAGSAADAMNLIRAAAAAVFAYVGIVWVAYVTGHS